VSKEKKAENIERLEELRRKELLGESVQPQHADPTELYKMIYSRADLVKKKQAKMDREKRMREQKDFEDKFLKRGRAYKQDLAKKQDYKESIDS
jgi:hypothetical protein